MPRHALAREITAALVFKAAALVALYLLFFAPSDRADAMKRSDSIVGAAQTLPTESSPR